MRDWYLELRDSDGNDCTVFDVLVRAETADEANRVAFDAVEKDFGGESDGDWGAYYSCDCPDESDMCDGHGGWTLSYPAEPLDNQLSIYHRKIDLRESDSRASFAR